MHGAEYDELVAALAPYQEQMTIKIAEPLLGEVGADGTVINADKEAVAEAVVAAAAVSSDTALVLMGHGTSHDANVTYTQMQTVMNQKGYSNVFVGTVEGEPEGTDAASIIAKVKAAGYSKVVLRPLMVVAGDHANNDMADPEDPESWLSQFTADGSFSSIDCQIAGLGEIPAVQQIYVAHINDVLNQTEEVAYVRGATVSFNDTFRMNFYIELPEGFASEGAYAVMRVNGQTTRQDLSDAALTDDGYKFSSGEIVAKEIRDDVHFELYNGEDKLVTLKAMVGDEEQTFTEGFDYSIFAYCNNIIANSNNAEMKAVAQTAIDFCTAVQIYLEYNNDGLAVSSDVTSVEASALNSYKSTQVGKLPGGITATVTCVFEGDNSLRLYLAFPESVTPDSYTYSIDGQPAELQTKGTDGSRFLQVEDIYSNHLADTYTYAVGDYTITMSALTYARALAKKTDTTQSNIGKAMYLYYNASNAYFND